MEKKTRRLLFISRYINLLFMLIVGAFLFFSLRVFMDYSYEDELYANQVSQAFLDWHLVEQNVKRDTILCKYPPLRFEPYLLDSLHSIGVDTSSILMQGGVFFVNNYATFWEDPAISATVRAQLDKYRIVFNTFPLLLIVVFLLVRGWNKIKQEVVLIDKEKLHIWGINNKDNYQYYLGRNTLAYRILNKGNIVLGTDFFKSGPEQREFMLHHEVFHLKSWDALIKNFVINLHRFYYPIFSILFISIRPLVILVDTLV